MRYTLLPALLALAACGSIPDFRPPQSQPTSIESPGALPPPPVDARTIEDFDTTTVEQREAATSTTVQDDANSLGTTVASLGDASSPGFWLESPLVSAPTPGRVRNPATGRTVSVELRPAPGGSSRISLAALRLLEAPLTELVTLEVFLNT
ncbi:MAG: hypothetical protein AAGA06_06670 [Pseudomonadota bacterium]